MEHSCFNSQLVRIAKRQIQTTIDVWCVDVLKNSNHSDTVFEVQFDVTLLREAELKSKTPGMAKSESAAIRNRYRIF